MTQMTAAQKQKFLSLIAKPLNGHKNLLLNLNKDLDISHSCENDINLYISTIEAGVQTFSDSLRLENDIKQFKTTPERIFGDLKRIM